MPLITYMAVILMPNVPINIATATSFTNGEVIRYAKVTPNGIPPFTKPINNGIDEQEQNGVIAPNSEAKNTASHITYAKPDIRVDALLENMH